MRDLQKAVKEYRKKYSNRKTNEAAFYSTDYDQIYKMSKGGRPTDTIFYAIGNALEAGFMVGYRKAQRDKRKATERKLKALDEGQRDRLQAFLQVILNQKAGISEDEELIDHIRNLQPDDVRTFTDILQTISR